MPVMLSSLLYLQPVAVLKWFDAINKEKLKYLRLTVSSPPKLQNQFLIPLKKHDLILCGKTFVGSHRGQICCVISTSLAHISGSILYYYATSCRQCNKLQAETGQEMYMEVIEGIGNRWAGGWRIVRIDGGEVWGHMVAENGTWEETIGKGQNLTEHT